MNFLVVPAAMEAAPGSPPESGAGTRRTDAIPRIAVVFPVPGGPWGNKYQKSIYDSKGRVKVLGSAVHEVIVVIA